MKAALGICQNPACREEFPDPVELYDGPGRYCPRCGQPLQRYEARRKPFAIGRDRRRLLAAASAAVLMIVASFAATRAFGPGGGSATMVVCGSSITNRLASDVVLAYAARHGSGAQFEVRDADCDVRFSTALDVASIAHGMYGEEHVPTEPFHPLGNVVGHDGIVAIVNPQNPVSSLSLDTLAGILRGLIGNWSSVRGANAPIAVYLPADATDEARIVKLEILRGAAPGSNVVRVPSSADVVRAVTAANGANRLGIVAFSSAVPAKVLSIAPFAPPSTLSISQGAYPLSLGVTVNAPRVGNRSVADLVAFSTSDGASDVEKATRSATERLPTRGELTVTPSESG